MSPARDFPISSTRSPARRLIHHFPRPTLYRFAGGTSILEIRQPAFEEYLEVFAEIGHYAGGNSRVFNALLSSLADVKEIAILAKMQDLQEKLQAMQATVMAQGIAQGITQNALQKNGASIHT
jgi:hypothetical protein